MTFQTIDIKRPGFMGLNTIDGLQDSNGSFCTEMINWYIDREGQLTVQPKLFSVSGITTPLSTPNGTMALVAELGNQDLLITTSTGYYSVDGAAFALMPGGSVNLAPYIESVGDELFYFNTGVDPVIFSSTGVPAAAGSPVTSGVATFAFGHWFHADDSTDATTLRWSAYRDITTVGGSQQLEDFMGGPQDRIIGIREFNGLLVVFTIETILIFDFTSVSLGTLVPSFNAATLHDRISGVGCVSQNSIQNIGSDILWLGIGGVYSLSRVLEQRNSPLGDISTLIQPDVADSISNAYNALLVSGTDSFRSSWNPITRVYTLVINVGTTPKCYQFDFTVRTEAGTPRCWYYDPGYGADENVELRTVGFYKNGTIFAIHNETTGAQNIARQTSGTATSSFNVNQQSSLRLPFMDFGADSMKQLRKVVPMFSINGGRTPVDVTLNVFTDFNDATVQSTHTNADILDVEEGTEFYGLPFPVGGSGSTIQLQLVSQSNSTVAGQSDNRPKIQRISVGLRLGRKSQGQY